MIHNYSVLDNQKSSKNTFHATKFKVEENSRTFQGLAQKFKDSSRKNRIQGLFKTVRTLELYHLWKHVLEKLKTTSGSLNILPLKTERSFKV